LDHDKWPDEDAIRQRLIPFDLGNGSPLNCLLAVC
jgi:hypothetical protein